MSRQRNVSLTWNFVLLLVLAHLITEPLARSHELSQLAPNHLFCHIELLIALAIMDSKPKTDEIG